MGVKSSNFRFVWNYRESYDSLSTTIHRGFTGGVFFVFIYED